MGRNMITELWLTLAFDKFHWFWPCKVTRCVGSVYLLHWANRREHLNWFHFISILGWLDDVLQSAAVKHSSVIKDTLFGCMGWNGNFNKAGAGSAWDSVWLPEDKWIMPEEPEQHREEQGDAGGSSRQRLQGAAAAHGAARRHALRNADTFQHAANQLICRHSCKDSWT